MENLTRKNRALRKKKAARTSKQLRQFYGIGAKANKAAGRPRSYGKKVNEKFAEKYGRSASSVTHARMFSERVGPKELDAICKLRNKKGVAFGAGLVSLLFPLKKRKDLKRFLDRWRDESLSAKDLRAEIRAEFRKPDRAGGKSKQPNSLKEATSQLHDRCSIWLKWYEQFSDEDVGETSLKDLPEWVQEQLKTTMKEVKKLQDVVFSAIPRPKKKMKKD